MSVRPTLVPVGQVWEQVMHLKALVRVTGQVRGLILEAHAGMLVASGQHQGLLLHVRVVVVPAIGQAHGQAHRPKPRAIEASGVVKMAIDRHQGQALHTGAVVTVVVAPGRFSKQAQKVLVTGHVQNLVYQAKNVMLPGTGQILHQVLPAEIMKVAVAMAPLHEHFSHARPAAFIAADRLSEEAPAV